MPKHRLAFSKADTAKFISMSKMLLPISWIFCHFKIGFTF